MSDTDDCRSDLYTVIARGSTALGTGAAVGGASGVSAIKGVHFTQSCTKPWMCAQLAVRGEETLGNRLGRNTTPLYARISFGYAAGVAFFLPSFCFVLFRGARGVVCILGKLDFCSVGSLCV